MASRFEIVDEEYIEEFKDKSENEKMKKKTEYWRNVFKKRANRRNFQANKFLILLAPMRYLYKLTIFKKMMKRTFRALTLRPTNGLTLIKSFDTKFLVVKIFAIVPLSVYKGSQLQLS